MTDLYWILEKSAAMSWRLLPYLLLGVLLGEALRYTKVASFLEVACRQQPIVAIVLAACFGIVSPLCTYGTVPIVLELLLAGIPIAPLATFLATSSLMNPQLLFITWGGLGGRIALAQLAAVMVFGLLIGAVLYVIPKSWSVKPVLVRAAQPRHHHGRHFTWRAFASGCWRALEFAGFYVLLGVVLGAAIERLVPPRWILRVFGSAGWLQVLAAAVLGVPLYACGGGTIPLVRSLITQGMAAGAALAFLVAGPATRVTPLMALGTLLRPAVVIGYVVALVVYAVCAGVVYGMLS